MKTKLIVALFATFFVLVACDALTQRRVTTPEERAQAHEVLDVAETGITVAEATGKVSVTDLAAMRAELATLRARVDDSEKTPVSWGMLIAAAGAFAASYLNQRRREASGAPETVRAASLAKQKAKLAAVQKAG